MENELLTKLTTLRVWRSPHVVRSTRIGQCKCLGCSLREGACDASKLILSACNDVVVEDLFPHHPVVYAGARSAARIEINCLKLLLFV